MGSASGHAIAARWQLAVEGPRRRRRTLYGHALGESSPNCPTALVDAGGAPLLGSLQSGRLSKRKAAVVATGISSKLVTQVLHPSGRQQNFAQGLVLRMQYENCTVSCLNNPLLPIRQIAAVEDNFLGNRSTCLPASIHSTQAQAKPHVSGEVQPQPQRKVRGRPPGARRSRRSWAQAVPRDGGMLPAPLLKAPALSDGVD